MMVIEYNSLGIGVLIGGVIIATGCILFSIFYKSIRKPKYDLHNLRKLVYDAGIKNQEVYKNIKELENVFKEIENA